VMAVDRPKLKVPSSPLQDRSRTVSATAPSPHQNHLLDALPKNDYERLAPHLELVPMGLGDVLLSYRRPRAHRDCRCGY
jgi:hypothetical protein